MLVVVAIVAAPREATAYSVLTHEANIDALWDSTIQPLLATDLRDQLDDRVCRPRLPHDVRDPERHEARDRLQTTALGEFPFGDDHSRRTTVEPGCVPRSDRAVLAKGGLQLGEHLQCGLRPVRFIGIEDLCRLATFDLDADDLRRKAACRLRGSEALL